jgi:hypothetical protein
LTAYGQPELVTWSISILPGTRLFVFPHSGRAVVAENDAPPEESFVMETWYFMSMPLEEFRTSIMPTFVPSSPPDPGDPHPEHYWMH